jgi:galactitol-specific phosphotransferase system IIB component
MISPGMRPGTVDDFAVGKAMEISVSNWENTLDVTKKQSSRKMTSISDAICTDAALLRELQRRPVPMHSVIIRDARKKEPEDGA